MKKSELKLIIKECIKEINTDKNDEFELERALKQYDWTYEMSDDHRIWKNGFEDEQKIRELIKKVNPEVAKRLIKKYSVNGGTIFHTS